jgi:hypothetical protein
MKFFKQLYDGGDEDTRRAMVKSMQESGEQPCLLASGVFGRRGVGVACVVGCVEECE